MTFRFVTASNLDKIHVLFIALAVVAVSCCCCGYTLCRKGSRSIEPNDWTDDKQAESHV